jgi:HAD superfamily hydrolase (TIGR01484 family)
VNKYIEKEISLAWYLNDPIFQDPKDWTGENWFKMVVRDDPDKLDLLRSKIESTFADGRLELCKSEADFFEIQPSGCNKGRGIKYLREAYTQNGMTPKIYACGDYENDLTMLAAADVAICPSNAHESVKKIADMCLCSCDDGVIADLIDKL